MDDFSVPEAIAAAAFCAPRRVRTGPAPRRQWAVIDRSDTGPSRVARAVALLQRLRLGALSVKTTFFVVALPTLSRATIVAVMRIFLCLVRILRCLAESLKRTVTFLPAAAVNDLRPRFSATFFAAAAALLADTGALVIATVPVVSSANGPRPKPKAPLTDAVSVVPEATMVGPVVSGVAAGGWPPPDDVLPPDDVPPPPD